MSIPQCGGTRSDALSPAIESRSREEARWTWSALSTSNTCTSSTGTTAVISEHEADQMLHTPQGGPMSNLGLSKRRCLLPRRLVIRLASRHQDTILRHQRRGRSGRWPKQDAEPKLTCGTRQVASPKAIPYDEFRVNPHTVLCTTSLGGHLGWFESGGGRWFVKPVSTASALPTSLTLIERKDHELLQPHRQRRQPGYRQGQASSHGQWRRQDPRAPEALRVLPDAPQDAHAIIRRVVQRHLLTETGPS